MPQRGQALLPAGGAAAAGGGAPWGRGAAAAAGQGMPIYALGGMTAQRVRALAGAAALPERSRPRGVAVIGAVFGADDPAAATRVLLQALLLW